MFVRMRDGVWNHKYLVDVEFLSGTNEITYDPAEGLIIGAAVNMNRVIRSPIVREKYPILAEASNSCASNQLRTRATITGISAMHLRPRAQSAANHRLETCLSIFALKCITGSEAI